MGALVFGSRDEGPCDQGVSDSAHLLRLPRRNTARRRKPSALLGFAFVRETRDSSLPRGCSRAGAVVVCLESALGLSGALFPLARHAALAYLSRAEGIAAIADLLASWPAPAPDSLTVLPLGPRLLRVRLPSVDADVDSALASHPVLDRFANHPVMAPLAGCEQLLWDCWAAVVCGEPLAVHAATPAAAGAAVVALLSLAPQLASMVEWRPIYTVADAQLARTGQQPAAQPALVGVCSPLFLQPSERRQWKHSLLLPAQEDRPGLLESSAASGMSPDAALLNALAPGCDGQLRASFRELTAQLLQPLHGLAGAVTLSHGKENVLAALLAEPAPPMLRRRCLHPGALPGLLARFAAGAPCAAWLAGAQARAVAEQAAALSTLPAAFLPVNALSETQLVDAVCSRAAALQALEEASILAAAAESMEAGGPRARSFGVSDAAALPPAESPTMKRLREELLLLAARLPQDTLTLLAAHPQRASLLAHLAPA